MNLHHVHIYTSHTLKVKHTLKYMYANARTHTHTTQHTHTTYTHTDPFHYSHRADIGSQAYVGSGWAGKPRSAALLCCRGNFRSGPHGPSARTGHGQSNTVLTDHYSHMLKIDQKKPPL